MKTTRLSYAVLLSACVVTAFSFLSAEEKPSKKWKNVTELSIVSANGNTKSSTFSGKNTFNYGWQKKALELIGGGLGANSAGSVTAEKYFASEKLSYKLDDRNYLYEKAGWEKDRFAGIRSRYDTSVGLGREIIKSPKDSLIAELGGGFVKEQRKNSRTNDFVSGRAYTKYVRTLSKTSNFSQDVEYLHNFEDPDGFRANTETALTAAINTSLSLKVSYAWHHVGEPPAGFSRNDTLTSVALVASY